MRWSCLLVCDRRDEILNPSVIIEVLSHSTEAYDRGDKFHLYRAIPSFCEYILINQHRPYAEQYCNNRRWRLADAFLRGH